MNTALAVIFKSLHGSETIWMFPPSLESGLLTRGNCKWYIGISDPLSAVYNMTKTASNLHQILIWFYLTPACKHNKISVYI